MRLQISVPLLLLLAACGPQQRQPAAGSADFSLPPGFEARVFAEGVGKGSRHLAIRDNGDVYVKLERLREGKGIVALRDSDGDGKADIQEAFGDYSGTGIELFQNYLYASSDTCIYRYALAEGQLLPASLEGEKIAGGFPVQEEHASKTFAIAPDGSMYVNVGAPSNACQVENRQPGSPGQDPCPLLEWQAGIWKFSATQPGQTQRASSSRYASGIRNAVAITWNSSVGSLYVMQHGRDQLSQMKPEVYDDSLNAFLPAEEFFQVSEGDFFGWPYCYFDPFQDRKLLGPEYGGDGQASGRCDSAKRPLVGFPGHMAPNDLLFYSGSQFPEKYRNGAFIAFHGSWNRAPLPQGGYLIAFVPMREGRPAGEWEIFADGFKGVAMLENPNDARFRPCGLAQGPDGSIYVCDSQQGRIWSIRYTGAQTLASH
jgi:glucose/arabinose dehydrogenase